MKRLKALLLVRITLALSSVLVLAGCYPDGYSQPKNATRTPNVIGMSATYPIPAANNVVPTVSSYTEAERAYIEFLTGDQRTILTITRNGKVIVPNTDSLDRNAQDFFKILESNWFRYSYQECLTKWGEKK